MRMRDEMNNNWIENQTLLVISPHPDDAIIGCGGLMAKVKKSGGRVYVLTIVVGDEPQYGSFSKTEEREKEEHNAMKFLKVDGHEIALKGSKLHLRLDTVPQKNLIDMIEKNNTNSIEKIKPTIVAIPSIHSENQDHVAVGKASFTALRPRNESLKHFPPIVLAYEQGSTFWSFGHFNANLFIDISEELTAKLQAMECYKSQIPKRGFSPRTIESIENHAKFRGSHICVKAAEAFEVLRIRA